VEQRRRILDNFTDDYTPYRESSINVNFAHMDIFQRKKRSIEPSRPRMINDVAQLQINIAPNITLLKPGRMDLSSIMRTEDKSLDNRRRKSYSIDHSTAQTSTS